MVLNFILKKIGHIIKEFFYRFLTIFAIIFVIAQKIDCLVIEEGIEEESLEGFPPGELCNRNCNDPNQNKPRICYFKW